jgi:hypothetical protein
MALLTYVMVFMFIHTIALEDSIGTILFIMFVISVTVKFPLFFTYYFNLLF